ncbi:hypothetical protein F904_02874 [Acinetobacter dispersus]|uniref:Uncharacterized protein n=1 Tax=Acinetobacter dispersus TaxID=70348 RepID=N9MQA0_9GAMM|nr:hypothetical protein F904_02874 [Acinetobacter dispersus]
MNMPCSLFEIMMIYLCNFPLPCGYIFILYERFTYSHHQWNGRAFMPSIIKKSCINKTLYEEKMILLTLEIKSGGE